MEQGFDAVMGRLERARSLLVVCHARPDGDALGGMLGLALAARGAGREAMMLVPDHTPE